MPIKLENIPVPFGNPNGSPRYYITNGTTAIELTTKEDMARLYLQLGVIFGECSREPSSEDVKVFAAFGVSPTQVTR